MTIETDIVTVVGALVSNRIYADTAGPGVVIPYVTYQQVGGQVLNPIRGVPAERMARIQFNVWATTRQSANSLMRQIEDALRASPYYGRPDGALIATYEPVTKLRGAQQDISFFWS